MAIPATPQQFKVTFPKQVTNAVLTWEPVAQDITTWEVNIAKGASLGPSWTETNSLKTRYDALNLQRGTQYTFGIRGKNADGVGGIAQQTIYTPIASLHNALFFRECVNYFDKGKRVSEHGNTSNLLQVASDNDYNTFTTESDLNIDIAVNGLPTRVDAVFLKCKGVTRTTGTPTGGVGSGWANVDLPATVKNWEGTDVSTTIDGFQHHLFLLSPHFTATSVRMQLAGSNIEVYEIMLLEFGREIDANGDFTEIDADYVDRDGDVREVDYTLIYNKPIGYNRDKWEIQYEAQIRPNKTVLKTPEEFLYWRARNRNHVHVREFTRFPSMVFPSIFPEERISVRYKTDDKTGTQLVPFQVSEA